MGQQTRLILKGYLETGDYPTQAEFIDVIDSLINIKDDGYLQGGVNNITAHAGGGQGSAWQLTMKVNEIATVASPNDSAKLPIGVPGMILSIWNNGGNNLALFPSSGGEIDGAGVDNSIVITPAVNRVVSCYVANKWFT